MGTFKIQPWPQFLVRSLQSKLYFASLGLTKITYHSFMTKLMCGLFPSPRSFPLVFIITDNIVRVVWNGQFTHVPRFAHCLNLLEHDFPKNDDSTILLWYFWISVISTVSSAVLFLTLFICALFSWWAWLRFINFVCLLKKTWSCFHWSLLLSFLSFLFVSTYFHSSISFFRLPRWC